MTEKKIGIIHKTWKRETNEIQMKYIANGNANSSKWNSLFVSKALGRSIKTSDVTSVRSKILEEHGNANSGT